jgi:hypothetical protein
MDEGSWGECTDRLCNQYEGCELDGIELEGMKALVLEGSEVLVLINIGTI